jgi:hypothetical protein
MSITQKRHKNSKIVYLKRLPLVIHESNKDLQEDYFAFASRSVGSAFAKDSIRPITGLTIGEENLLLPLVLNIPKEDRDFRQKVTDHYHEITTKVKGDKNGTALEIGLEYNNEAAISEDGITLNNPPLNVGQYLAWKHAQVHPEVAESEDAGRGNMLKAYFIYDPAVVTSGKVGASDVRDKALEAYLEVKKDNKKVDMYLTLLGINHYSMDQGEKVLKLRDLADKKPAAFNKVHADKNKDVAYFIDQCIVYNVLKAVGTRVLITESAEDIGRDKEATILYLKDAKNGKQVLTLKAQLRSALKKAGKSDEAEAEDEEAAPEA